MTSTTAAARTPSVLIVDDDENFSEVLCREIARLGFGTTCVASGTAALDHLEHEDAEVILLDIRLGDRDGIEVLGELKERGIGGEVIILTGHGTVENAIAAMKAGAFDFITKPCKLGELEVLLEKAAESYRVKEENKGLRQYLASDSARSIITSNSEMIRLLDSLDRVARSDVPVLITGESGTGKELIAREIHQRSSDRDRAFVTVNCAVLQPNILESELFGHEKGAFTGAVKRRLGLFEIASGGSIFLDEIGEIDEGIQAKLLRVLQFGEFRRVGGNETRTTKVRVIAATNKDLERAARENTFRQDLFFRLNVVPIALPPLRDRPEDIEPIARHFLAIYGGKRSFELTDRAVTALRSYSWPGNIRELENVVQRLLIFHGEEETIDEAAVLAVLPPLDDAEDDRIVSLGELERRHIMRTLARFGGNKKQSAEVLGISLKTLYNKLHSYGWKAQRED